MTTKARPWNEFAANSPLDEKKLGLASHDDIHSYHLVQIEPRLRMVRDFN